MADARTACPDWLDPAAQTEWLRQIETDQIDPLELDTLAVSCFVHSLRQRVGEASTSLGSTAVDDQLATERQRLLTILTDLEERLTSDLKRLSTPPDLSSDASEREPRPTQILVLDEGPSDP